MNRGDLLTTGRVTSLWGQGPFFLGETQESDPEKQIQHWIEVGHLCFEKCEIDDSIYAFKNAYKIAKDQGNKNGQAQAIVGLLRAYGENGDHGQVVIWDAELDRIVKEAKPTEKLTANIWYCKGTILYIQGKFKESAPFFLKFISVLRKEVAELHPEKSAHERRLMAPYDWLFARGISMLANVARNTGKPTRAAMLGRFGLRTFGGRRLRGVDGVYHMLLGWLEETKGKFNAALVHYQQAHVFYLQEHNWYHHLTVLWGYARISRKLQNFSNANFYLDLIEAAIQSGSFEFLRKQVKTERDLLNQAAVDLWVDVKQGVVKTREGSKVSIRKQYVLLEILKALSKAHEEKISDSDKGLSKSELIEQVWKERYRPDAHDNKLYYNINRLRKILEPDMKEPRYLLNWREGYRLAPGLKVHFVDFEQAKKVQQAN